MGENLPYPETPSHSMAQHAEDISGDILTINVPYSEISRFDKSGNLKVLTKVDEPPNNAAMNPVKRFIISTAGIFFLMVGLIGLFGQNATIASIACLVFGILIIWTFIARPEMQKKKAAVTSKNAEDADVSMIFGRQKVVIKSPYQELTKDWSQLAEYKKTKKGVHLNFVDGTEAFVPIGIFYDDESKRLTKLLESVAKP